MSLFVVDVEADGPCPGLYSMVSFGAVLVKDGDLDCFFYGKTKPMTEQFIPGALAACNTTREQHLTYDDPKEVMTRFSQWIAQHNKGKPVFLSDNPAFDWQFIHYYFIAHLGNNPFGRSARRIGDLYAGLEHDFFASSKWKSLKKTKHTHHPVDDAMGNVEAFIAFTRQHKLRVPLG